jgi:uncharacterized protein YkwD
MRKNITLIFLLFLTTGAIFLFRISLKEALVAVDIEELARYTEMTKGDRTATTDTPKTREVQAGMPTIPTSSDQAELLEIDNTTRTKIETTSPPPLKKSGGQFGTLTVQGVVTATNAERRTNGQGLLTINSALNSAASAKLNDMFAKQYFDHVGPDGTKPSDWVARAGYAYTYTGENLALGDFSGDLDLVTAWMNSPGHRANILKPEFTEIGVAVGKGMYEGRETWLAVQVFGKPMPVCSAINADLKATIATNQAQLETMGTDLRSKKEALESANNTRSPEYKAQVEAYNTKVAEYNALIAKTEELVTEYNAQVSAYNTCMAK